VTNLIVAFRNFANAPKNHHLSLSAACVICHLVIERPQTPTGGADLRVCRSDANILNTHVTLRTERQSYSSA
jgi:hypothetical protein